MSWARPTHRLIAGSVGLLVLGLVGLSLRRERCRAMSFVLLVLTVFLAWLGIARGDAYSPAVVMGNVGGGFAMIGIFAWLIFDSGRETVDNIQKLRVWFAMYAVAAILLTGIQAIHAGS